MFNNVEIYFRSLKLLFFFFLNHLQTVSSSTGITIHFHYISWMDPYILTCRKANLYCLWLQKS